jgi:prophage regulatory protein
MVAKQKSKQHRGARRVKQLPLPSVPEARKELLLLGEVVERTRISDRTLSRLEKAGRFPKRVKIGFKRIAWRTADIDAWIAGDAAGARCSAVA